MNRLGKVGNVLEAGKLDDSGTQTAAGKPNCSKRVSGSVSARRKLITIPAVRIRGPNAWGTIKPCCWWATICSIATRKAS